MEFAIFDEYLWYLRHWARGREAVYNSLCYFQWAEICIWYRVRSSRICYYAWKYATRSMKLRPSSQWYWTLDCYRDQLSSDMDLCHSLNNKVHSCRFSTSLFAQSSGYFRNLFPKWTAWAAQNECRFVGFTFGYVKRMERLYCSQNFIFPREVDLSCT